MARERGLERIGEEFVNAISGSESFTLARSSMPLVERPLRTRSTALTIKAISCAARGGRDAAGGWAPCPLGGRKQLKADRYRFYDLGLVASLDAAQMESSSFKRSLGGTFVSSGAEFEWVSPLLLPLVKLFEPRRMAYASR